MSTKDNGIVIRHLIQLIKADLITKPVALTAASSPADFERAMNFE